jgi:hypothetical protein
LENGFTLKQLFQEKEILEELGRVVAASLTSVTAHSTAM